MKYYVGIVGILFTLALVKCGEPSEEMKKFFEECKKEIGVSLEGPPNFDDPKIKCLSACILKKENTLVDGKIVVEKALEFSAKHLPGGLTDSAKTGITECANKGNEEKEECDVGAAFHKCMIEKHPH